jgi:hypothetical protein
MTLEESEMQSTSDKANVEDRQLNKVDIEELAKEIMKLLKKKLREENERLPR